MLPNTFEPYELYTILTTKQIKLFLDAGLVEKREGKYYKTGTNRQVYENKFLEAVSTPQTRHGYRNIK